MDQPDGGTRRAALAIQLLNGIYRVLMTGIRKEPMEQKKPNNAGAYYRKCENYARIIARMKSVTLRPATVSRVFTGKAGLRHMDRRYPEAVKAGLQALRTYPDRRELLARMHCLAAHAATEAAGERHYDTAACRFAASMELASVRTIARRAGRLMERLRNEVSKKEN